jgi:hypothetical protein
MHIQTYRSWNCMIGRCERTSDPSYRRYGGRGIRVCARWRRSFASFLVDMGERPAGTTLDRRDNAGDYEPDNCRWATRREQSRNTTRNVLITALGRTMCLEDWALHLGIHPETLRNRVRRGWDTTRALTEPVHSREMVGA